MQTYKYFELIIIDDCSNEETAKTLSHLSSTDSRISLIRNNKNEGAGICRNIGLRAAKYDFVAFCDSDDVWAQNKLEIQLAEMIKVNAPICCTAYVKKHYISHKKSASIIPPKRITHNEVVSNVQMECSGEI